MNMLNWIDSIIIFIIVCSMMVSLFRGFVREALSLLSWIIAVWVAYHYMNPLSDLMTRWIASQLLRNAAAFFALMITALILGGLVNYLLGQLIDYTGLTGTDRFLGIMFGALRGVLLVTILLLAGNLLDLSHEEWWKHSRLIPHFNSVQMWVKDLLPATLSQRFELVMGD